jgi:polysaccharide export outer membrane protein
MKKTAVLLPLLIMFLSISMFPSLLQASETAGDTKPKGEITTDSDTYMIGPEDVLYIYIWKEEAMSKTVPVRMDGKISLPLVDDIQAAGLTPLRLKEALTEKLKNVIDNPTVSVTRPGVFSLRSETSLVQLVTMIGGFTDWADQKNILILRKEKDGNKRITVNYKKIIEGKDPDVIINRGDMIVVPD